MYATTTEQSRSFQAGLRKSTVKHSQDGSWSTLHCLSYSQSFRKSPACWIFKLLENIALALRAKEVSSLVCSHPWHVGYLLHLQQQHFLRAYIHGGNHWKNPTLSSQITALPTELSVHKALQFMHHLQSLSTSQHFHSESNMTHRASKAS